MFQAGLPIQLSSFIGREREIAEIMRLLTPGAHGGSRSSTVVGAHTTRLLTLTGPSGIGKTCLAIEAADDLEREYPTACASSIRRPSATLPWLPPRSPKR